MTDKNELRACPFCGPGELQTFHLGSLYFVQCTRCDIERTGRTEADAAEAWNTRKTLAAQRRDDGWQPIESAPRDGTPIHLYDPEYCDEEMNPSCDGHWSDGAHDDKGGFQGAVWNNSQDYWATVDLNPSHWQPLPKAPNDTALSQGDEQPDAQDAYTKRRIGEIIEEGDGFWKACSGCQESSDGCVSTKDYPYSDVFRCHPGSGCSECGGIGVIWDGTDYEEYAKFMLDQEQPDTDGLADELERMANGLRGSMWANRNEIIDLLDKAAKRIRAEGAGK